MSTFNPFYGGYLAGPGINAPVGNVENTFYWNNHHLNVFDQALIDSATVDSGNTVTTVLRPGLLLGKVYSTGKVKQWSPTATDGSQYIFGILENPGLGMADSLGTAKDRWRGGIMIRGAVKPQRLLIPGQASFGITGISTEYVVRNQLQAMGFLLMDDPNGTSLLRSTQFGGGFSLIQAKTADYTVKVYESGTMFTNRGASAAVNFTLPTTAYQGLYYGFYLVEDYELMITAGTADTLVVFNDKAADTLAITSTSSQIGTMVEVYGDGTGWLTRVSPGQAVVASGTPDTFIATITT